MTIQQGIKNLVVWNNLRIFESYLQPTQHNV